MKLYIIRHGETPWNAEGRLQGQTDIPLNENGIRLAKITGEALKDVPFDFAISSPLKRARQTAELVLAGRQIPVLEDARIEELSFGSWEGLGCRKANFEIPSEHFQDFYKDPFHFQTAADGETIEQLCGSFSKYLRACNIKRCTCHCKDKHQDKTEFISAHIAKELFHGAFEVLGLLCWLHSVSAHRASSSLLTHANSSSDS